MIEEYINQGGEDTENQPDNSPEVIDDETISHQILHIQSLIETAKLLHYEPELNEIEPDSFKIESIDKEINDYFTYLIRAFEDLHLQKDDNYYSNNFVHTLGICSDLADTDYLEVSSDSASMFLDERIDDLGKVIEDYREDTYVVDACLYTLLSRYNHTNSESTKDKCSDKISRSLDYILQNIKGSALKTEFIPAILHYNNIDQVEKVTDVIKEEVSKKNYLGFVILTDLLSSTDEVTRDIGQKIFSERITGYGLDPQIILDYWRMSDNPDNFSESLTRNLKKIDELEKVKHGISQALYENFGITDFDRYPNEVLIKQFDTIESQNPYGIILYPKHDHNGAFYNDKKIINDLFEELGDDYLLRVLECTDASNVLKSLLRLNHKYGGTNKIQFSIVGGHGTKNSIQFGDNEDNESIFTENLIGDAIKKPGRFFVDDPTIILVSCSTGENNGIGQKLSEVFKAHVFAPDKPTSLKGISASISNHELIFDVQYGDDSSTNQYLEGERAGSIDL